MTECGAGHDQHLCQLIATNEPLDSIKDLVKDAKFICANCKRVASSDSNLCNSQPLD
ncbi:MAG: hypothetical protein GWP05_02570 [Anaerolineaceae bacterium]|nr:hypothetical protein [Anaerolineaceae bacterium]